MLNKLYLVARLGLVGVLAGAAPAMAEDQLIDSDAQQAQVLEMQSPFGGEALDYEVLAKHRGGTDSVINDMKLSGVVSGNKAFDLATGSNAITEGAFAGVSGVPMVVQNTGNNVLIQSATIVNVRVN